VLEIYFGKERLFVDNVILTGATVLAGVLGIVMHSVLSHRLVPRDYGAAFTVITLLSFLVPASSWLGLVMARTVSHALAENNPVTGSTLLRAGNRQIMLWGGLVALLVAFTSPLAGNALHLSPVLVVLFAPAIPFTLALPLLTGALQGTQRFGSVATVFAAQAGLRLVGATALGAVWSSAGVIAGITLASLVTYAWAWILVRDLRHGSGPPAAWRSLVNYSLIIIVSSLLQAVLLTTDVVVVQHYYSGQLAGEYSVVAVLGRGLFWISTAIAIVLFPKVVSKEARGLRALGMVAASLALVAAGGLVVFAVFSLEGRLVLTYFAGRAYIGAASYMGLYAIAMTLLGLGSVLMAVHQSRGKPQFLWVLAAVTVAEPIGIAWFHQGLTEVVATVAVCMAALVVGMAAILLLEDRRLQLAASP